MVVERVDGLAPGDLRDLLVSAFARAQIAALEPDLVYAGWESAFAADAALAVSMGLEPGTIARLMAELGFRPAGEGYAWRGRARPRPAPAAPTGAFAALAGLVRP